jgi:hypothetical protein
MFSKKDLAPASASESIPISENCFSNASKSGCPSFGKNPKLIYPTTLIALTLRYLILIEQ